MQRHAVKSSNVKEVGYDAGLSILEVEFHSGAVYEYCPVSADTYEAIMDPGNSAGQIINQIKRDPNIACERVDAREPAQAEAAS